MKKTLFALALMLLAVTAQAQTGNYMVYKEYDPDTWIVKTLGDNWYIDINDDDIPAIEWYTWYPGPPAMTFAAESHAINGWKACSLVLPHNPDPNLPNNFYFESTTPFNDTSLVWGENCYAEIYRPYPNSHPLKFKVGLRHSDGENYYYGWAEFEEDRDEPNNTALLHLSRTCYCTIPNYPLVWGQTSLTEDIVENEATAFATLHPNPTTGQVTIMGQDLKAAVVFNTLGQQVATASGDGETLHIDIANLPAGVYFVNITDGEGRKCVKKVVKE